VQAALAPHLEGTDALDRLTFAPLDMLSDDGWRQAVAGCTVLVHTASPFPIAQPRDPDAVIRPAVEGTRRALAAAADAGIERVVLTSSTAAVLNGQERVQDEDDWCDPDAPGVTPYTRSKTLAERAAWDMAAERGLMLTTINPGFVLGRPLDAHFGSSVGLVRRLLSGRDPMLPRFGFPVVDVVDVAEMHLRAVEMPTTIGQRLIAAAGAMWMDEMGRVLKAAWPDRRIATRAAPRVVMRVLALWDPEVRSILPELGRLAQVSNLRARREMEMEFTPPEAALRSTADFLIDNALV
jgi:dihydroflavonol-4-reductase